MPALRTLVTLLVARTTAVATAVTGLVLVASPASAAGPPLFVSEINADNGQHTVTDADGEHSSTQDNFEFFEVANTTGTDADLADHELLYNGTVPLTLSADRPTVVPAGGTLTLWLRYSAGAADGYSGGSPNSELFTDADFRSHYGMAADTPVGHVTGQAGMANGGGRSIVIARDGQPVSDSTYGSGEVGPDLSAHFAAPASGATAAPLFAARQQPSPGALAAGQLQPAEPEEPEQPGVPEQGPPPPTDPTLRAPLLQVTEVAPDTANVGSADGYEFIEVYNSSDAPVSYADFTVNYLYIDAQGQANNQTEWRARPDDPVIEPGRTLVLWVKNGQNDDLTAADFNAHFGSRLTAGEDLVELDVAGMANAGLRGIQVATNSGHVISDAYYFSDDQTVAATPIQYAWNPGPPADGAPAHLWTPDPADGAVQTMTELAPATPGYAAPEQVPAGLVATPSTTTAPEIVDLTGSDDLPGGDNLVLGFDVRDDHQVRTVELTIRPSVGEAITRRLRFVSPDRYVYEVPEVDLYGQEWVEYTLTAGDGTHLSELGPVRVPLGDGPRDPVRINQRDGDYVAGRTWLRATAEEPEDLSMAIDGEQVTETIPSMEDAPRFAFEATSTDAFFRNGVKLGDEVLTVFDEGFYERVETVSAAVPAHRVLRGEELTVGIYAGTKAWPDPDPDENNDDFSALDPRLALPDGRVLRPVRCAGAAEGGQEAPVDCPEPGTRFGFSDASMVYFLATFEVPDDAFGSISHDWDTTAVADGPHEITATAGGQSARRTVVVDNTAPEITSSVEDGATMRGSFEIGAEATDAGSGLERLEATLDGEEITLPHPTSSVDLAAGEHVLGLTAVDALGNTAREEVRFTTPEERPSSTPVSPEDGAELSGGKVSLEAEVEDPTGDPLDVELRRGYAFPADDEAVTVRRGTTHDTSAVGRDDAVPLTQEELEAISTADGVTSEVTSPDLFPYQLFTVDVPQGAPEDSTVRVHWAGSVNADARVLLHVLDTSTDRWKMVDEQLTTGGLPTDVTLDATVPVRGHVADGQVTVLVQHSVGFTTPGQSTRGDDVAAYSAKGVTPRDQYDFTVGWESDTQYYNENPDYYRHQQAINRFFVDQRSALDLQYVAHTGDIVDDWDQPDQWRRADESYRDLDEADIPYGVLAGNHDVGGARNDYGPYGQWFGDQRFAHNPWFGGSHQDNRGHYDLISADGVDLMVVSMGWGAGDEQIDWMNEVIAAHPERKVFLNLHEFMLTTGGLGPVPQRIMDEVVRPNANVFAVGSGHYHDAFTRLDSMDDDGDGVDDRTVYSMLFDYQGLPEGGLGYLRLLHFDNVQERILVRTYSPSLDDFDSEDPSLDPQHQEFEIPYAAGGITSVEKRLTTDEFTVDVLTTERVARFDDVASGSTVEAEWRPGAGEHGWYVHTADEYGASHDSSVQSFTLTDGTLTAPRPSISGDPVEGGELVADPGEWGPADPEVELSYRWLADGEALPGEDAPRLALTAEHVGSRITVEVTGRQPGYTPATAVSDVVGPVEEARELVSSRPRITGQVAVGRRVTADAGRWSRGAELAYTWLRGGEEIPDATGRRLRLTPDLAGARLTVQVTGTLEGHDTTTRESRARRVTRGTQRPDRPRIRGVVRVGQPLRAVSRGWQPGTELRFVWTADGQRVGSGPRLRLRPQLRGDRVRVRVVGESDGYRSTATTSRATHPVRGRR